MALRQIVINSKSSGKYEERTINGRPHLVTTMVSIEGDSVMNRLFYPNHEVASAYQQLNDLPAPASHPVVDGRHVSASHPLATNAHNIGAFIKSPALDGKQVINELAIDIEVAEKDERGVEALRRIRNAERIGVSTGLNATMVSMTGKHDDDEYEGVVSNITFDHVAILLDEMPAGKATYTQNNQEILICNLAADESVNELQRDLRTLAMAKYGKPNGCGYVWVVDVLLDPPRAIVELEEEKMLSIPYGFGDNGVVVFTGEGVEVERKTSFEPVGNSTITEEDPVDVKQFLAFLVANSAFNLSAKDIKRLADLGEADLAEAVTNSIEAPGVTPEAARAAIEAEGLTINEADFDAEGYKEYLASKDEFAAFQNEQKDKREKLVASIIESSDMEAGDLEGMNDAKLERLSNSLAPAQDFSGGAPAATLSNRDKTSHDEGVVY